MLALLFIIGVVAAFFFAAALVMLRRPEREWVHLAVAIPCLLLGLLGLAVMGGLAWAHYTPPPAAVFLEQLQASADRRERTAVLVELKARGFVPVLYETSFPVDAEPLGLAAPEISRSASYLTLRTERVRPRDLFAEYLEVVFLFDPQQQLITWHYQIVSSSL